MPRSDIDITVPNLSGTRAVLTGGSDGIGLGIAQRLAEPDEVKRHQHAEVGRLDLLCQVLLDPHQSHRLLVCTADPGTESSENLQMLTVIGAQRTASS